MMRFLLLVALACSVQAAEMPTTAAGWKVELVAQAPEIRHPSVVCAAPDGRVFVAEDPMDIREDTPPESRNGRIVCMHLDGRRTVFAEKLHAVFGMQYLEGNLYVLHNPQLTVFRDDAGVGREPRDILTHTLAEPWALGWNDHIPANFKLGMDGWFYLAVGDKGLVGCTGSDGRVLDLRGGGVVRFRPDGSELEIFSTGVRNILDVAMNAEDEMFTYDNTDEHEWMGRFTHMVERGDYGYPHDFIPRRPYTLWMMHDFGAGAACGALCATDGALAPEMAGNVFIADFGQRQVTRVGIERDGATWRVTGSEGIFSDPPDDFRPVGLGWMPDGRGFYLCDWQHRDTKANVDAGRVWRVTWMGAGAVPERPAWWQPVAMGEKSEVPVEALLEGLAHPAMSVRMTAQRALAARDDDATRAALRGMLVSDGTAPAGRRHALWALDAGDGGASARAEILALADGADAALAAQALRQLGQRRVAKAGVVAVKALAHGDATVRFQAATLIGHIGLMGHISSILARLADEPDATVRYALFTAMRGIGERDEGAWPLIVAGLGAGDAGVRDGCLFALREVWAVPLIPLLRDRAMRDAAAATRLGALIHQPAPYRGEWWSYHPAKSPPPPRTTRWLGTEDALAACRDVLSTATLAESRIAAATAFGGALDTASVAALRERLAADNVPAVRAAALAALAKHHDAETAPVVADLLRATDTDATLRLAAIRSASAFGPLLAGELTALLATERDATTRLALIAALEPMKSPAAREPLRRALREGTAPEKAAALKALAVFADPALTPDILATLDASTDGNVRRAAVAALASAPDARAVPAFLDALAASDPALNDAARNALGKLAAAAMPLVAVRMDSLTPAVRGALREIFSDNAEAAAHPAFSQLAASDPRVWQDFAMKHDGDAWRGQQVFHGSAGVSCAVCHQVAGHGGIIGPDLTLAGKQFSRAELIESVLYPSKAIRDGYRLWTVTTHDGAEHTGSLKSDAPDGLTLADVAGQATLIPRANIREHRVRAASLMPEGLHAPLTPEQFADLVAYMVSRKSDPRTEASPPLPEGFTPLFNGRDLAGWRMSDLNRSHWSVKEGRLEHDGIASDLWSERELGDFALHVEWRWPDAPALADHPVIDADGRPNGELQRVLDAGDSGIFLRGLKKAQANLFCYPVGSGEFWEYREDAAQPRDFARTVTPKRRADAPVGDWNTMRIIVRASTVTITLNGQAIIETTLPNLPASGPIGFQHEHGRVQIRAVGVKELP